MIFTPWDYEFNGKAVEVGNFIGKIFGFDHEDVWEIDIAVRTSRGNKVNHMAEKYLMRIDGHEETESQEAELEHA